MIPGVPGWLELLLGLAALGAAIALAAFLVATNRWPGQGPQ
jgi:hypothetical protein